jgi:integrase
VLKSEILPAVGNRHPRAVARADVKNLVEKVASRGSYVSANRVLDVIGHFYRWANERGHLEGHNPTLGLKKRRTSGPRTRVLNDEEIRTLWMALKDAPKMSHAVRDAFRLQLLLGVRIGEALGTAKTEVDFERMLWTIPSERTKSRREHRLPLSPMAQSILAAASERAGSSKWLLPSPYEGDVVLTRSASHALRRLCNRVHIVDVRTHDLRRTMATRVADMGVSNEVIERILNHAPKTIAGKAYIHSQRLDEIEKALGQWSDELEKLVAPPPRHLPGVRVHIPGKGWITTPPSDGLKPMGTDGAHRSYWGEAE